MPSIKKYCSVVFGILLVSIAYNLCFAPFHFDTGGVSGLSIVITNLFPIKESVFIFILNMMLLVLSFIVLGKTLTKNTLLGSLLFPLFISLTSFLQNYISFAGLEEIIVAVLGGVLSGVGFGLVFKNNFTSGGTDILNQIAEKKFKIPMSKSMIFVDGAIVLFGGIVFGIEKMIYSIIALILISVISNKTMLGINKNKVFYIHTQKQKEVKNYLTKDLKYDITIFEVEGGFSNQKNHLILCSVDTSNYYRVKTGIELIDPKAFLTITEAYEIMNQNAMVPKEVTSK